MFAKFDQLFPEMQLNTNLYIQPGNDFMEDSMRKAFYGNKIALTNIGIYISEYFYNLCRYATYSPIDGYEQIDWYYCENGMYSRNDEPVIWNAKEKLFNAIAGNDLDKDITFNRLVAYCIFQKASILHDPIATYFLSKYYSYDTNTLDEDHALAKAILMLHEASKYCNNDLEYSTIYNELGFIYGERCNDYNTAKKFFIAAASYGSIAAAGNLSSYYCQDKITLTKSDHECIDRCSGNKPIMMEDYIREVD